MDIDSDGIITLSNEVAECKISLWGGNLVSYCPKSEGHDVFWLGDCNKFDNIHAIRGGIPVCWPRFAEEELNNNLPRHGFARLSEWRLKKVEVDETKIEVLLNLVPDAKFGIEAKATVFIKITDKLEYKLETINKGDNIFEFSEALHAYFNISSLDKVKIKGLTNHRYKNSLNGSLGVLDEDLKINAEFDAIFLNHKMPVEIIDEGWERRILIEKVGSDTTVVWNPDKDLAEMSQGQYKKFVCVEPSNVGDFSVKLKPHEKHQISMKVQIDKL